MQARRSLMVILFGMALIGAADAYLLQHRMPEPSWWRVSSMLGLSLVMFAWYYFDSRDRSYVRSKWLNIAVVALAVLAIPYYVLRSREKGQKAKALVKLLGFAALCVVFETLGRIAGAAVP